MNRRSHSVFPIFSKCLWPECSVSREPPLNYEEERARLSHLLFKEQWGPVWLLEFRRVLVSPYGVIFRRGRVVAESVDYSRAWDRNAATFYKKILLGRIKRFSGLSVVVHNSYYRNYYHWTLEALPRLYSIRDRLAEARVLLCAELEPFHLQSLELFRPATVGFIRRDELGYAEELLFPTPVNSRYGQHNPTLLREMAAWIRARTPAPANDSAEKLRLYIVRVGDKPRRLANEEEVLDLVGRYGFRPVILERMSVTEQIALFSRAAQIIGVHGAGLSNMLYMTPPSLIVELMNERYHNACYFNLASALGHKIVILPCQTVGDRNRHPKYYDLVADTHRLADCLERYGRDAAN
ncbi:MAG: glycosyltransferase family 61 protein [Kiritimatiellia bacterium]